MYKRQSPSYRPADLPGGETTRTEVGDMAILW